MRSFTPLRAALATAIVVGALFGEWYVAATERHDEVGCRPEGNTAQLPGLPEGSSAALSTTQGVVWTLNDSGDPEIFAVDSSGTVKARVRVTGASVRDWEDISAARCARGSCLYIADIGDNNAKRADITVYRVPEPALTDTATAPAERFTAKYPDGAHDAEALFVSRDGGLFIITKEKPAAVYRFPEGVQPGTTVLLQQAGMLPIQSVTDAEASPDGEWIAVRTNTELFFFRAEEFALGAHGTPIKLAALKEPQGEGVAVAQDGRTYLIGEGKHHQPGTLALMRCTFPHG